MCARAIEERVSLKDQLAADERRFQETGALFGLTDLRRKKGDPGTYEAVWHILLNICNSGWSVGCKVSSSPIAVEGGDALWALHLPTGEAVATSRGITAHPGLLSLFIRSLLELGYEDDPGIRDVISDFLGRHGYLVDTAGEAAVLASLAQMERSDAVTGAPVMMHILDF